MRAIPGDPIQKPADKPEGTKDNPIVTTFDEIDNQIEDLETFAKRYYLIEGTGIVEITHTRVGYDALVISIDADHPDGTANLSYYEALGVRTLSKDEIAWDSPGLAGKPRPTREPIFYSGLGTNKLPWRLTRALENKTKVELASMVSAARNGFFICQNEPLLLAGGRITVASAS